MSVIANMQDDVFWMREAYAFAAKHSPDKGTQNGAVIVRDGSMVSMGVNCFPVGVVHSEWRLDRPQKYTFTEHAERNAIFSAAKQGRSTLGATMYCPWSACAECARAIIQAGIKEVVWHDWAREERADWSDSLAAAAAMFDEAEVLVRALRHEFRISIRFNGKEVVV